MSVEPLVSIYENFTPGGGENKWRGRQQKPVATVIVYRVNGGTEAKVTAAPVTAKAKYPGTRGNQFSFTVSENPVEGFDVQVNLAGSKVAEYTGLKTVEELVAQDCEYITFSGTGALVKNAGANLTGGTDVTMQNADVTALLDASEGVKFNCMCFPFTEAALQAAAKTKIKYIRENIGKGVQIAIPNTASGDYEGVINVTNSVTVDGVDLTAEEACAWVAAATAAAKNTQSNTYVEYDGATAVVGAKTHEEAVAAIKNGEFFFSVSEESKVVVEYDINSLVSFKDGKDKSPNCLPVQTSGVNLIVQLTLSRHSTPSMNTFPSLREIGFLLYSISAYPPYRVVTVK